MESSSYVFKQTEYEQWHNINISLAALFNNYHLGCMTTSRIQRPDLGINAVSGVEGNFRIQRTLIVFTHLRSKPGGQCGGHQRLLHGCIFFLKNRYISHFSHFMPKIKYFAENEEKIQKSKIMNQKQEKHCIFQRKFAENCRIQ